MRRLIYTTAIISVINISLFVCIVGCGGPYKGPVYCMNIVQEEFGPEAEIVCMPGYSYKFIVRDSKGVWIVNTTVGGEISSKALILKPKQWNLRTNE